MSQFDDAQTEQLRQALLSEIYAGAFGGGLPAMLTEEDAIRGANAEELRRIAEQFGL